RLNNSAAALSLPVRTFSTSCWSLWGSDDCDTGEPPPWNESLSSYPTDAQAQSFLPAQSPQRGFPLPPPRSALTIPAIAHDDRFRPPTPRPVAARSLAVPRKDRNDH